MRGLTKVWLVKTASYSFRAARAWAESTPFLAEASRNLVRVSSMAAFAGDGGGGGGGCGCRGGGGGGSGMKAMGTTRRGAAARPVTAKAARPVTANAARPVTANAARPFRGRTAVRRRRAASSSQPTQRASARPHLSLMFLRALLLSCAIANATAFIAPSRAPQWLAPQLASGRAAVLPPRALPTASVTNPNRNEVDKRFDVLQVCPARHPVALRVSRAWPPQGVWGAEGKPGVHPKQVLVRSAHSSIRSKPALSIGA